MHTEILALEAPIMSAPPSNPEATRLAVAWIKGILDRHNISGTKLAIMAGLASSTVLRIVNDKNHKFTPSLKTLQSISTAVREPIPDGIIFAQNIGASMITRTTTEEREARRERLDTMAQTPAYTPAQRQAQTAPTERRQISILYVSNLPKSLHPSVFRGSRVDCPPQMEDDPTAFAFYQPDAGLAPVIPGGTLMYATKKRDPQVDEIVLVTANDGRSRVRIVKDINAKGLELIKGGSFDDTEPVAFDDIEEIAVVVGTWRA